MVMAGKVNSDKIRTVKELQQDVAELLDYLHTTRESSWDLLHIRSLIMRNMQRFDENIRYYRTPINTDEYVKLLYNKADITDLIDSMTRKHTALGKLVVKDEYADQVNKSE